MLPKRSFAQLIHNNNNIFFIFMCAPLNIFKWVRSPSKVLTNMKDCLMVVLMVGFFECFTERTNKKNLCINQPVSPTNVYFNYNLIDGKIVLWRQFAVFFTQLPQKILLPFFNFVESVRALALGNIAFWFLYCQTQNQFLLDSTMQRM